MSFSEDLAAGQYGLVTKAAFEARVGTAGLRRAVRTGYLVPVARGVYRLVGSERSFRQQALAACLVCGPPVVVSHRWAAVLWGTEGLILPSDVEVAVPEHRSARRPGMVVHRVSLPPGDTAVHYGIPVTSPARTLLDLARVLPRGDLERALDDFLRLRACTVGAVAARVRQAAGPGHFGVGRLRALVERRATGGVPDSPGVARILRWIERAGLPAPQCDYIVRVAGRVRRIDMAYPAERVAIEYNGRAYHQMASRIDEDHARTTELELAGWLVIVVTAAHEEAETVDRIRRALELRGATSAARRPRAR